MKRYLLFCFFAVLLCTTTKAQEDVTVTTKEYNAPCDWTSSNHDNGTEERATWSFSVKAGDILEFNWSVSSEGEYDKLTISVNEAIVVEDKSGEESGTVERTFSEDTDVVIKATYKKDWSNTDGDDCAKITNMFIVRETESFEINDGAYDNTGVKYIAGNVIYNKTFSHTLWQAWYAPFEISHDEIPENIEFGKINNLVAYDDNGDGEIDNASVNIIKVNNGVILANCPYLVRAKETGNYVFEFTDKTVEYIDNQYIDCSSTSNQFKFIGTYKGVDGETMYSNGYYAPSSGAIRRAASANAVLKPYRWYMSITARDGKPQKNEIKFRIMDSTTGIDEVTDFTEQESTVIYDLSGRRVESPTTGIYIVNGKKVYIK